MRPRLLLALVVLGAVILHLPAFAVGFYADDHVHQLALEGRLPLGPLSLYDFGGTEEWRPRERDPGGLPWWTSADWRIRFFRPLASASLALDHALWGERSAGYHATSLVLFAALLVAAYALHRALGLSRGAATGAVAFLGVSQATVLPVVWIANRNALLAAGFTTAAVLAASSHSRLGRGRSLAAALGLGVLACLSKESGVAAFALVAAWYLFGRHDLPRQWARGAAAAALVLAASHVVFLFAAGYGTRSLFYATPWRDPLRYATNLGLLGTIGGAALATPLSADLVFFMGDAGTKLLLPATAVVVLVAWWAHRRLRGMPDAAYLLLWTVVSLLPEGGAPTSDRLLLTATVGASGLLARLVEATWPRAAGRSAWERAGTAALVVSAGALEALVTLALAAGIARTASGVRERVLTADVGPPSLGRREVIVLQSDDPLVPFAMAPTWAFHARDLNLRFDVLQMGRRALRWSRIDERTHRFVSLGEPFADEPFEIVYRAQRGWPDAGVPFETPEFTVEVVERGSSGPARPADTCEIVLRFRQVPDNRVRFLVPRNGRLVHVAPPPPGTTVELPEAPAASPFAR